MSSKKWVCWSSVVFVAALAAIAWRIESSASRVLEAIDMSRPEANWEPRVISSKVGDSEVETPEVYGESLESWKRRHLEAMRMAEQCEEGEQGR